MGYLLIGIGILIIIVGATTYLYSKKKHNNISNEPIIPDAECCGAHDVCEKELKKIDSTIHYFDDEELDIYAGKKADTYDDVEIDLFRDILYTLKKEEIEDWLISLEKRNIELPNILRPEAWNML